MLVSVYERAHREIATAVEMLLNHRHLAVEAPDVVASALSDFRSRPSLGFSDCLMLAVARKAGHVPLGTFNRALGKLEGTVKL